MIKPPSPPDLKHCPNCGKVIGDHKGWFGPQCFCGSGSPGPFARKGAGGPLGTAAALGVSRQRFMTRLIVMERIPEPAHVECLPTLGADHEIIQFVFRLAAHGRDLSALGLHDPNSRGSSGSLRLDRSPNCTEGMGCLPSSYSRGAKACWCGSRRPTGNPGVRTAMRRRARGHSGYSRQRPSFAVSVVPPMRRLK